MVNVVIIIVAVIVVVAIVVFAGAAVLVVERANVLKALFLLLKLLDQDVQTSIGVDPSVLFDLQFSPNFSQSRVQLA